MPTALQNLQTRQQNITNELAAMGPGLYSYTEDGKRVDRTEYRKSLYDELQQINEQITILQGPFEDMFQGFA